MNWIHIKGADSPRALLPRPLLRHLYTLEFAMKFQIVSLVASLLFITQIVARPQEDPSTSASAAPAEQTRTCVLHCEFFDSCFSTELMNIHTKQVEVPM